jgi:hypothetical protein
MSISAVRYAAEQIIGQMALVRLECPTLMPKPRLLEATLRLSAIAQCACSAVHRSGGSDALAGAWRVTACEQNGSASSMVIQIPSHDPADEQREAVCSG